jgi:hypothetical protein
MDTEGSKVILGRLDRLYTSIHAKVPELDLATATAAYELALSASLEVDIVYPLFMLLPHFDHGSGRLLPLIVDSNSTVTETGNENVTFYLVRRQRSDAGTRPCWQVLLLLAVTYSR